MYKANDMLKDIIDINGSVNIINFSNTKENKFIIFNKIYIKFKSFFDKSKH